MSKAQTFRPHGPAKAMPASPKPISAILSMPLIVARLAAAAPSQQIRMRTTLFDSLKSVRADEVAEQGDEMTLRRRRPPIRARGEADRPARFLDRIADRDEVALIADL